MRIHTGVYWSRGARRGKNQDSLSVQRVRLARGECLLAVVCDGVGGLPDAEEASGLVVRLMTEWFYRTGKALICRNSPKETILLALQEQILHIQEILQTFQKHRQIQTGTTLSALLLARGRYYTAHIGDSRIYELKRRPFRAGCSLRCLTRDDTDERGRLLRCLGVECRDRACFACGRAGKNGFLLCTDGFYRAGEERIGGALGPLLGRGRAGADSCARRLELLADCAVSAGSRDNMTAVFCRIETGAAHRRGRRRGGKNI